MIVSHEHRFIFLKVRKTAGTSVEVALSRIAGDDAIVTPIAEDETGHHARNHKAPGQSASFSPASLKRLLHEAARDPAQSRAIPYFNHMPAWLVRAKLGEEIWGSYFKFCFERNPWDKVVSMYGWNTRDLASPRPFEEWLFSYDGIYSDWPIYTLGGKCAVDFVGRYEALIGDFRRVLHQMGLFPDGLGLPALKSGFRREVRYSPEGIEHIGRIYRREIEMLGYGCPHGLRGR